MAIENRDSKNLPVITGGSNALITQTAKEKLLGIIQTTTQKAAQRQQQLEAKERQAMGKQEFKRAFWELSKFYFALNAGKIKKMSGEQLVILDQMLVRKAWKDLASFPLRIVGAIATYFSPSIASFILPLILLGKSPFLMLFWGMGIAMNWVLNKPLERLADKILNCAEPQFCWNYIKFRKTQFNQFLTRHQKKLTAG